MTGAMLPAMCNVSSAVLIVGYAGAICMAAMHCPDHITHASPEMVPGHPLGLDDITSEDGSCSCSTEYF